MNDNELNPKQKLLLKKVRKLEEPTHSSLHEEKDIEEYDIKKRTVESMMRKLEDKEFVESSRPKNAKVYDLTSKGNEFLDRILKRERQRLEKSREELSYEDIVAELVKFFEETDQREEINHASKGRSFVRLDVKKLLKFNLEVGEKLLEEPKQFFQACREAISQFADVNTTKNIRPVNASEIDVKTISDLKSGDIGDIVFVEGVIQSASDTKSNLVSAIFECSKCGDRYEKDQRDNNNLKSPYKCECGSKRFKEVNKTFQTVRIVQIKEKPEQDDRETIPVIVEGEIAEDSSKNLASLGSGIRICGYLENYKEKKSSELFDHRLRAKNVEIEKDKWEELEITDEDVQEIKKLSEQENIVDHLSKSLAHEEIAGRELLKEAFTLFPLSRTEHTEANTHFLCIGEPSTGKSHLASIISDVMPKVMKTTLSSGSTKVGLTGAVTKNEKTKRWEAESGAIPMSDGGFHITDEIDKPANDNPELLSAYNEPLSEKKVTLNKANIHTELPADVSEFAIGNPKSRNFHDESPKYQQNPIENADLNSRFPIKLAIEQNDPDKNGAEEEKREEARKIMNRGSEDEGQKELLDTEMVVKYLVYAQDIHPKMSEEVQKSIEDKYVRLWKESPKTRNLADGRFLEGLVSITVAYAKLELSEEVTERHIEQAYSFIKRCYNSLDFIIGRDDGEGLNDPKGSKTKKVRDKIEEIASNSYKSQAQIEEVIAEVQISEKEAEAIINRLMRDGELFEPEPGIVKEL